MSDDRPIGVFDSGVGGLTVLRALQEALPNESTIYFGDLARCPYGTRPQAEVREFAVQIGDLLAEQDIKLLVVACNTATAAAFEDLRRRYRFPVVGVIEPGAIEAARLSKTKRIGVVATDGTVASGSYRAAILDADPTAEVVQRPASWLVPLIEQGPVARGSVSSGLRPLLQEMRAESIDILILGCTHFPLIRDIFAEGIGNGIITLDSAETTATEVARTLDSLDLLSTASWSTQRFLITGPAGAFQARAEAMFGSSPLIETLEPLVGRAS